jgi:arsenate reductase-like glutaredoxin family protein
LRERDASVDEIEYAKSGLGEDVVLAIVAKVGSVAAVLNTRHAIAKERGWVAAPPSAAAFAKAVVADVNLLKRPIYIDGDKVIVGFDRDAYGKLKKSSPASKPARR